MTKEEILRANVIASSTINGFTRLSYTPLKKLVVAGEEVVFYFLDADELQDVADGWNRIVGISVTSDGFKFNGRSGAKIPSNTRTDTYHTVVLDVYGNSLLTDEMRFGSDGTGGGKYTVPDLKAQVDKAVLNGATEMSLTSPSGKVFKITVADDGTLTATEATT